MKRVLVVAHSNAAGDEILEKVLNSGDFKRQGSRPPIVRVGLNATNVAAGAVQTKELLRSMRETRSSQRRSNSTEVDLIQDAEVVFTTIGSMFRLELLKSTARFDMIVVEEAAKIQDGDLLTLLTLGLGGKAVPEGGRPIPLVFVGDERQLAPYTGYDPNATVEWFYKDTLFERYLRDFRPSTNMFDYCAPMLLKTQHRSHSAIAAIYSSFASDGCIQTRSRSINSEWSEKKMDEKIMESRFPEKAVTVLRYNGESYRDRAISNETEGGIANAFEQNVVESVCRTWCSQCSDIETHILVPAPYKAQVREVQKALRASDLNGIEVCSVNSAQGKEKDIVIVSLSRNRTGSEKRNAFFNDRRRINVMLSRAGKSLF